MQVLIDCARGEDFTAVVGEVLSDNSKMLNLMSSLGFKILPSRRQQCQTRGETPHPLIRMTGGCGPFIVGSTPGVGDPGVVCASALNCTLIVNSFSSLNAPRLTVRYSRNGTPMGSIM